MIAIIIINAMMIINFFHYWSYFQKQLNNYYFLRYLLNLLKVFYLLFNVVINFIMDIDFIIIINVYLNISIIILNDLLILIVNFTNNFIFWFIIDTDYIHCEMKNLNYYKSNISNLQHVQVNLFIFIVLY